MLIQRKSRRAGGLVAGWWEAAEGFLGCAAAKPPLAAAVSSTQPWHSLRPQRCCTPCNDPLIPAPQSLAALSQLMERETARSVTGRHLSGRRRAPGGQRRHLPAAGGKKKNFLTALHSLRRTLVIFFEGGRMIC